MHIKRIHDIVECLTECAKHEVDKGIENLDTKEFGEVADIIKDLCEAEYYASITKAMKESEYGEDYDYEGRRYYDDYRYKTSGRFAPKGKGSYMPRRGYEESPYWHMTPEHRMTVDNYKNKSLEELRDMDLQNGKRYYTEPVFDTEMYESKYDKAKRHYTETKEMHKANTPEDKQKKMGSLEEWLKDIGDDIMSEVKDMSAEEKSLAKTKLSSIVAKMQ